MALDDPIGVLASTRSVVERASWVSIDLERVEAVAAELAAITAEPTSWAHPLHFTDPDNPERSAAWVFVLDALNFCFWSDNADANDRWRVEWRGETVDGYWALAAALSRAMEEGFPLDDPAWLANCTPVDLRRILRPADSAVQIPLFGNRLSNLQELGRGLLEIDGGAAAAANLLRACNGSAAELVARVAETFPSFNDIAFYRGQEVRFYKRAQILAADLAGALEGHELGRFTDLDRLTAFADYKVPQVLRQFGILAYDPDLADRIARRELLPPGSDEEIEIRAATVWGVEHLRLALARLGHQQTASEIDWLLWQAGQTLPADAEPYHRTLTIFY
jgi:hypothetical protein